jgi:hypothetical protein
MNWNKWIRQPPLGVHRLPTVIANFVALSREPPPCDLPPLPRSPCFCSPACICSHTTRPWRSGSALGRQSHQIGG